MGDARRRISTSCEGRPAEQVAQPWKAVWASEEVMAAAAASIATCSDSFMMVVLVPFGKLWGVSFCEIEKKTAKRDSKIQIQARLDKDVRQIVLRGIPSS